jgi:FixJ family two-component response regulator
MAASSSSPPGSRRSVVLVVEDDPAVRRALCRLLRTAGYAAKGLASGGELLGQEWPGTLAGIVLDVHLPDMNGLALVQRIRERDGKLALVVITADSDPELRAQALRQGASAFLTKPFEEAALLAELRRSAVGFPGT